MFGWDKRLGYSCGGCGHVYFISNITIYHGIKSGFIRTLWELWHPAEVCVWQWMTDFFDGGDIWYPVNREAFEERCKREVKESDENITSDKREIRITSKRNGAPKRKGETASPR